MTLGVKLNRIQLLSIVLFVLASVAGIGAVQISRAASAEHSDQLARLAAAEEVAGLLSQSRVAEAYLIFADTPARREMLALRNRAVDAKIATLDKLAHTAPKLAAERPIAALWRAYLSDQQRLIALVTAGDTGEALMLFTTGLEARNTLLDREIDGLIGDIQARAAQRAKVATVTADGITVALVVIGGFGILLGVTMLYLVRRGIVAPLTTVTQALSRLAAGDRSVAVLGAERRDEIGEMVRALEVFRSHAVSLAQAHLAMQRAQTEAEAQARHDALTGLPNRRLFVEALTLATQDPAAPQAVLLIDLDRFKPINDAHGHDAGDVVLCTLAERFGRHRDEIGTIARLGGDEFALVMPIPDGPDAAVRVADLLGVLIAERIALSDTVVEVGATIGIAIYPTDAGDPEALLRAADLAMYRGKARGRSRVEFFEPSLHDQVRDRAMINAELRRAITAGEIVPHYQPLVLIEEGELVGFEILARWHHPTRGPIMPDLFIPVAEERGLLTDLTYRLLRQACLDSRSWPPHLRLSLNLSPSQLRERYLAPRLLAILTETGVSPQRIEIEVTENALIGDLEGAKAVLSSLQNLGMTIALDDFGTGYSSLYHLRDLQFDKIKIDKSFLERLDAGEENAKIVHAIIRLSKTLGLSTTAEGVEDAAQWSQLSQWGCDYGQGYLFGKALSAKEAAVMAERAGPAPVPVKLPRGDHGLHAQLIRRA